MAPVSAADPLLQLNVLLWASFRLPPEGKTSGHRAVLSEAGYMLDSIGRRVTAPHEARPVLQEKFGQTGVSDPDVLLAPMKEQEPWLVVECKAQGFGTGSESPVGQAYRLLVGARDLAPSLYGKSEESRAGTVTYLVPCKDKQAMEATLDALTSDLEAAGLSVAPSGALCIIVDGSAVRLGKGAKVLPGRAEAVLADHPAVIKAEEGDDPRPLYLIPYDPSVAQNQSPTERAWCRNVLFARGLRSAALRVMKADVPGTVVMDGKELLHEATYGTSAYWREADHVKNVGKDIVTKTHEVITEVKGIDCTLAAGQSPARLEIRLRDESMRTAIGERLLKVPPAVAGTPVEEPLPLDWDTTTPAP